MGGRKWEWPEGWHDVWNSARSPVTVQLPLTLLWTHGPRQIRGMKTHPDSGMAVLDDVVYLSEDYNPQPGVELAHSVISALPATGGEPLWTYDSGISDAQHDGLMTIDRLRRHLYYPDHRGYLNALDLDSGALLWELLVADPAEGNATEGAPALSYDGVLYYVSTHFLWAIRPERTGPEVLWRAPRGPIVHGVATKPIVDAERDLVYFGGYEWVWGVDRQTSERVWAFHQPGGTYGFSNPHFDGRHLYVKAVVTGEPVTIVTCIDVSGMQRGEQPLVRWERAPAVQFGAKSAMGHGQIVISNKGGPDCPGGGLIALDRLTGARRWSRGGLGEANASPAMARNCCLVGTHAGELWAVDYDGSVLWSTSVGEPMKGGNALARGRDGIARFFIGSRSTFRVYG